VRWKRKQKEAIVDRNEDTWPHYSKKKAILALPILMEACPVMVQLHINILSKKEEKKRSTSTSTHWYLCP